MKIVKTSKILKDSGIRQKKGRLPSTENRAMTLGEMNLKASKNNQGSNSKQKHYGESDHFNIKNRKRL